MPGIAQVLLLAIRGLLPKGSNPGTQYIYAKLRGFDDMASDAMDACCKQTLSIRLGDLPEAHVRHALAITIERDRRIRHFLLRIRVRGGPQGGLKPLVDGFCACREGGEQHFVPTDVGNRFREFALDVAATYSSIPSVIATIESDILQKELQEIDGLNCKISGRPAYPERRIREWLLRVEGYY